MYANITEINLVFEVSVVGQLNGLFLRKEDFNSAGTSELIKVRDDNLPTSVQTANVTAIRALPSTSPTIRRISQKLWLSTRL